jgi:hypothetical protein
MPRLVSALLIGLFIVGTNARAVLAQTSEQTSQAQQTAPTQIVRGVVVSATHSTLVVKTRDGQYHLFELTADTTRPLNLRPGSTVAVASVPGTNVNAPYASMITVTAPPPQQGAQPQPTTPQPVGTTGTADTGTPGTEDEPVPASVRQLEKSIQRQTARYRLGVRSGFAMAPELVLVGVQSQLGPFFNENIWARPNVELGFGELSTMIALNFEAVYRIPAASRTNRYQTFFGGGFGLNFINKSLSDVDNSGNRFNFSDFIFDSGLNLVAGVQTRTGPFFELRATVYSEPTLRLVVGFIF